MDLQEGVQGDGYPRAISQIVAILFSNSLAHAFGDAQAAKAPLGRAPKLTLSAKLEAGMCHVSLMDNGCGIDEGDLGKIFDLFFTTKPGRGGTGLGLSIAHGLAIDALAGSLSASTGDWGSRFDLVFPPTAPEQRAGVGM